MVLRNSGRVGSRRLFQVKDPFLSIAGEGIAFLIPQEQHMAWESDLIHYDDSVWGSFYPKLIHNTD